jgi:hypothetical protein
MNLSLPTSRVRALPISQAAAPAGHVVDDDAGRIRQLRALLSLLVLYAAALLFVILLSDGADIGCILTGIGGHVLYASGKTALAWREASWLEAARARVLLRRHAA